ncbi:MAG: cytochrome C, partial [Endomicrobiales bacterium]
MIFPPYNVPYIGNGMIIGCNAVLHVLISHGIAIGSFALIALGELNFGALSTGTAPYPEWTDFRRDFIKFAVFSITIVGAVTGTGIWFTTMALAPRAISTMLRIFFWAWFFEYGVFLAEIVSLIVLFYTWDMLLEKNRGLLKKMLAGYVVLSCTSAIAITGNLGFMLT